MHHGHTEEKVTTGILTLDWNTLLVQFHYHKNHRVALCYRHPRWPLIKPDLRELSKGLILI